MDANPNTTDPIVCHCLRVTKSQVEDAIAVGSCSLVKDVMNLTNAGGGCTACHRKIRDLLAQSSVAQANRQPSEDSPICIAR